MYFIFRNPSSAWTHLVQHPAENILPASINWMPEWISMTKLLGIAWDWYWLALTTVNRSRWVGSLKSLMSVIRPSGVTLRSDWLISTFFAVGKKYHLPVGVLGQRSNTDLRRFTRILGIDGLFPRWDDRLLGILLGNAENNPFRSNKRPYENCGVLCLRWIHCPRRDSRQQKISFMYKAKRYSAIEPYRLVSDRGSGIRCHWGRCAEKVSSFQRWNRFSPVTCHLPCRRKFICKIENAESIWYGAELTEVLMSVSARVAPWFLRRALLPGQKLFTLPQAVICSWFHGWLSLRPNYPSNQILDARGRSSKTSIDS